MNFIYPDPDSRTAALVGSLLSTVFVLFLTAASFA